jgi:hypothetical protein
MTEMLLKLSTETTHTLSFAKNNFAEIVFSGEQPYWLLSFFYEARNASQKQKAGGDTACFLFLNNSCS